MIESANTSETPGLLSARNAILAAAALLVLSVVGSCLSMLRPADSDGFGHDSFGTRRDGFRALAETLAALGIQVSRDLAPPRADKATDCTLVLIDPDQHLIDYAPKYVAALRDWVERGGRLVVSPSSGQYQVYGQAIPSEKDDSPDLLHILRVEQDVRLSPVEDNGTEYLETESESYVATGSAASRIIPVAKRTGPLAELDNVVDDLAVPGDGYDTLKLERANIGGTLAVRDTDGTEHVLVAALPRGQGEIIVVGDARLFANANIARGDNSVLAAHLLSPDGRGVVFDEFYHGLAVRGNPLYLLTRPEFAAVTLGLLALVGVWAWRAAVFLGPPLTKRPPSRRDIGQYIDAMGSFFARGPDHRRFVAREVRDGVLHQLCQELGLPPDTSNVETILAALRRRDPKRAERLGTLLQGVDRSLADPGGIANSDFLPTMQRLAGSL